MISDKTATELAIILSVQNDILKRLDDEIQQITKISEESNEQKNG